MKVTIPKRNNICQHKDMYTMFIEKFFVITRNNPNGQQLVKGRIKYGISI